MFSLAGMGFGLIYESGTIKDLNRLKPDDSDINKKGIKILAKGIVGMLACTLVGESLDIITILALGIILLLAHYHVLSLSVFVIFLLRGLVGGLGIAWVGVHFAGIPFGIGVWKMAYLAGKDDEKMKRLPH